VDDAYRGKKIGTHLLQAIEDWAKEHSVNNFMLQTGSFQAGLAFYQHHGYEVYAEIPMYNPNNNQQLIAYQLKKEEKK